MPQRLLRPTLRQSKRWNRLSWFDQSFYIRLLTIADDYGRYEADPELLRSELFPYGDPDGHAVSVPTIVSSLRTFASKDLIVLYEVDSKQYLQLLRWKERARTESRFPEPVCGHLTADCGQMTADCGQMSASPPSPSPSPSPYKGVDSGLAKNGSPRDEGNASGGAGRKRFVPPSLEQVKLAAAKAGLPESEAEQFWNFWESWNWSRKGQKMTSWERSLVTWKGNWQKGMARNPKARPDPESLLLKEIRR